MRNKNSKILVVEPMFSENLFLKKELLKEFNKVIFNKKKVNKKDMIKLLKDIDGIILGLQPFDSDVINSTNKLKFVAKFGTGLDNVDLNACKKKRLK